MLAMQKKIGGSIVHPFIRNRNKYYLLIISKKEEYNYE